jgi:hypothetical protein
MKQRRVSISHALEFALKGVFLAENSEAGGWGWSWHVSPSLVLF